MSITIADQIIHEQHLVYIFFPSDPDKKFQRAFLFPSVQIIGKVLDLKYLHKSGNNEFIDTFMPEYASVTVIV